MCYVVKQDGLEQSTQDSLEQAIKLAEALLGGTPADQETTFTVETEGRLYAAVTNRRICGTFVKQKWGGRSGDDAIYVAEDTFDGTIAVLRLTHAKLIALQDSYDNTDEIGLAYFDWNGPCEVTIVDSICDYFGVSCVEDVSPEALAYAVSRENPQPDVEAVVELSIKVRVRMMPGTNIDEFVENLDYSITSGTVGISVRDTEIVAAS